MADVNKKEVRFHFGKNWKSFLHSLNEGRIKVAVDSLIFLLKKDDLSGVRFLDVGSGSGLFSLAARRLGAYVHSFDYDEDSVSCTATLKNRFFLNDDSWVVERGSVLDKSYLSTLGRFDVVYSWGVLHHTGKMWEAFQNVADLVEEDGALVIAIYNHQGIKSSFWKFVKITYCKSVIGRFGVLALFIPIFFVYNVFLSVVLQKNIFKTYKNERGMSIFHDWVDWLGGYPFEYAKVDQLFRYFRDRGFVLVELMSTSGLGTNQLVFRRSIKGKSKS